MLRCLNALFAFPANTRPMSMVKPSLIGVVPMAALRIVEIGPATPRPMRLSAPANGVGHVQV